MRRLLSYLLAGLLVNFVLPDLLLAQSTNPYHMNGSALQENCNCYTLTKDEFNQSGSVWNINKINLNNSFDYKFNVFLGCRDGDGADGIVFVLQPISTSVGTTGEGLGFGGISPSIGVAIDTWQNTNQNDPFYDHLAIHKNGDVNHSSPNNLAGPVVASNINIEDCNWHTLHIVWDAAAKRLSASVDEKDSVVSNVDLVATVFNNDPEVFWGFTGATGGAKNHQRFCTSLNPGIASMDGVNTCYPTTLQFTDSSFSFGSIVKWFWDFGDGTTDTVRIPPAHTFPAPGIYNVTLKILGNNGCLSDQFTRVVTVGSKPIIAFELSPPGICENEPVKLIDSSKVAFGTINEWNWTVNGWAIQGAPNQIYQFATGTHTIGLQVKTKEGCVSDLLEKQIQVEPKPQIQMQAEDACFREPVLFEGNLIGATPVKQWYWNLGDGKRDSGSSVSHVYLKGGEFMVKLYAAGNNGCLTDTLEKLIHILSTNAFAGRDTIIADNQPLQLNGSGGMLYQWIPATALSDATIANPIATPTQNIRYVLYAYTPMGCGTYDTINIKVYKGPAIYVPNAFSPNGDRVNPTFRFIPVGMTEINYFRVYNRYGQLVYSSTDSQKGWDGTINGKPQAAGTYVWMISGKDFLGKPHFEKGTVTLVR
jgi:gliding motility-associated-like protein